MSDTVETVIATLRLVAEQVRDDRDRAALTETADQIERGLDDACCPLCQEVTCDDTCPLQADRAIAMQEPCGFVHDQWLDGIYRNRRRCVAKAGHTTGQFAYDHGPWESAQ